MIALVTGGTTGLGLGIAEIIREAGTKVDVISTHDLVTALRANSAKDYIDCVLGEIKYDFIINNFGLNSLSWIGETKVEDEIVLMGNVMVPYWVVNHQVAIGATARVLNISSITHRVAQRTTSIYCASKAAVAQMTRVMARELAPKGWVVNCFAPGKIEGTIMAYTTDAEVCDLRGWSPEEAERYAKSLIPMGRYMNVNEAATIAWNILNMPDYVNGQVIEATGGV